MALIELPSERRAFISELAEDVWFNYAKERLVFLDGIAEAVDVTLSYGDYGDCFDGLLEHKGGSFHIYCNVARGQPYGSPRARFTVAHELGHYFIDEHRNALAQGQTPHASFTENPSDNPVETEANTFAASLLMPKHEFLKAITEVQQGLNGVMDLASTFGVSIQSTALRYTAISGKPCGIVMLRDNGTTWWDISPQLKSIGYQWVQKIDKESIPDDSATGIAIHDSASAFGPVHQRGTVASAWFRGALKGSNADRVFSESAVRLRSRGVLVFLEPIV